MTERGIHRAALAVDLDQALAALLPAALAWHNAAHPDAQMTLAELDAAEEHWTSLLLGSENEGVAEAWASLVEVDPVAGAKDVLKPLRKFFTLLVFADRPRSVEKATRAWLDAHYGGVFDKVLFVDVDAPTTEQVVRRKRELCAEFKVKAVIGADARQMRGLHGDVEHRLVVGNCSSAGEDAELMVAADWSEVGAKVREVIDRMELTAADKASHGPKLARYTDDLVTVSARKSAPFYASMVQAKFVVQKQRAIRLQASDRAITTAVQTAELVTAQGHAVVSKIQTQYVKRFYDGESRREPKIEIELTKTAAADQAEAETEVEAVA